MNLIFIDMSFCMFFISFFGFISTKFNFFNNSEEWAYLLETFRNIVTQPILHIFCTVLEVTLEAVHAQLHIQNFHISKGGKLRELRLDVKSLI